MPTPNTFLVHKQNLNEVNQIYLEPASLQAGEVLFKIDTYALTTNNITYAVCGFSLKYWNFFPATEPWGIVPAWGFAEVAASQHPDVEVGERVYGYFPMSQYLKIQPGQVKPHGFSDISPHREALADIYNFYSRVAADSSNNKAHEDYLPILKPLFVTSFLIYYFLKEEQFLGADHIVLTSASSKTALALAFMLKQHQPTDQKKIIGLTSAHNKEFVAATGYYDTVLSYTDYQETLANTPTFVIDFAGNTDLLLDISKLLGEELLRHISRVGLTDWESGKSFKDIPNSKFFFAPAHIQKRYQDWGIAQTNQRINKALGDFITDARNLLEITYVTDLNTLSKLYLDMLGGNVNPKKGFIVKM